MCVFQLIYSQTDPNAAKKPKTDVEDSNDFASEDSIFKLLTSSSAAKKNLTTGTASSAKKPELHSFANLISRTDDLSDDDDDLAEQTTEAKNYVPIDWGLKTKLRILTNKVIPGARLKTNEEASGITGYVLFSFVPIENEEK